MGVAYLLFGKKRLFGQPGFSILTGVWEVDLCCSCILNGLLRQVGANLHIPWSPQVGPTMYNLQSDYDPCSMNIIYIKETSL
jgi:hypothetical protein